MRRRKIVTLLTAACLMLSGCGGGTSRESAADTGYNDGVADYEDETATGEETITSEDYEGEAEINEDDMDTNVDTDAPVEAKGIITMVLNATAYTSTVQVVAINSDTGSQNVISEFCLEFDKNESYDWLNAAYCTMRERFSEDYTKMIVNKHLTEAYEDHAGWVDTDGNFFDVTEAISTKAELDFFDTEIPRHRALGFKDGRFVFLDLATEEVDCVPLDDISTNTVTKASEKDDEIAFLIENPIPYSLQASRLSSRINAQTYIGDFDDYNYSAIYDVTTGTLETYIPEAERYNWSGVLNPGGDTVAFLSGVKGDGTVDLYTMSMSDKNPAAVTIEPNDSVIIDWSALKANNHPFNNPIECGLDGVFASYDHEKQQCCLLEWR